MSHDGRAHAAVDGGDVRQYLRRTADPSAERRIAEIVEIFQAELRCLRGNLVLRAALRIDPK